MARIDTLLQHMTQNGAGRAVLSADAPSILEAGAGAKQGKPMAGAQIEAMIDEIMPADARQNLQNGGRADFAYRAPSGAFNLSASQPDGKWHLEITPAQNAIADAQSGAVAASNGAADSIVVAPITPETLAPETLAPETLARETLAPETLAPESASVELAKKKGPPRFDPSASGALSAPPPSPPGGYPPAAAPPSGYAPAGNNAFSNDSGMGDASVLPAELQGFNWGALFGSWIWSLGNSVWIGLLCLVPCVGFFMRFYLGAKGNEMAWKSKRWDSIQSFRSAQTTWAIVGGVLIGISLFGMVLMSAILFPVFARARENARRSACQSNLKRIGLATLQFSQAHNETLPVGTTMAQWKPQLQPYLGAGSDHIFVCPSHEGAGESYEINPKLSGASLANIKLLSETPLVYEPQSGLHLDGSSFLFVDGHVKWFREQQARALAPK